MSEKQPEKQPEPLEPFPTWLAVLTYVEHAASPIFYHAPMDRQPVRVQAVRGRGSYANKVKITPPAASLRPSHPDRADPFWADADHLQRFRRIPEERHREIPPAAGTKQLTQLEFRPQDFTIAQQLAERLGYKQYPYTSTSDLIGLYCLRENPEYAPAGSPQYNAVIIRTKEFGIMVVQDLEDLRMEDLWRKDREK